MPRLELRLIRGLLVAAIVLATVAVLRLAVPLPWSSSGAVYGDQGVRLARADDGVRRAAEHAAAVDSQVKVAVVRRQVVLRRVQRARERVRIASAESLAVALTPGGPVQDIGVPPPVIERMVADSSAIVALRGELLAKDSLLGAQRARIGADSVARAAAGALLGSFERERHPRCGRRCGMLLGAVAAIAVTVVVNQVASAAHGLGF